MRKWPTISVERAVEISEEAVSVRRIYCDYDDEKFFKMTDFLEFVCGDTAEWKIKLFASSQGQDFKRKAGVVALGTRATITVDERIWEGAKRGERFFNYMLAHEVGHLLLNHHAQNAVTKNFQLYQGPNGLVNVPPTAEELEANYAAVFLQCGVALLDPRWDAMELARRAFSDPTWVKKAMRAVRVEEFRKQLNRPKPVRKRIVL